MIKGGERTFKTTGRCSKREAKQVEAKERAIVLSGQGREHKSTKVLLSDAIEQVYDHRWKCNKDGLGSYKRARRLLELMGNGVLASVGDDTVGDLIRKLESRGVSVATVNRYLATLKTVMKHYRLQVDHIKLKKERNGRIRVLTRDEELRAVELLSGAEPQGKKPYYREAADMVVVLVDTGMRLSEMLNLKYEDINFGRNLISIWINKGDRPRSIPMTGRVKMILEQRLDGINEKPFTISKPEMERAWQWVRAEMGLGGDKEFVLHALRHTCSSRLINAGIDVMVVKEWLGHSSVQITERYAHLNPTKLVQAVEVLEL